MRTLRLTDTPARLILKDYTTEVYLQHREGLHSHRSERENFYVLPYNHIKKVVNISKENKPDQSQVQ